MSGSSYKKALFAAGSLTISTLACVILLFSADWLTGRQMTNNQPPERDMKKLGGGSCLKSGLSRHDRNLGYRILGGVNCDVTLKIGEDTIYNVVYSSDKLRRRRTLPDNWQAKKYLLFFGCSVAFGEGVNDNETIPSNFSAVRSDRHVYNYAFRGYGPQHMLALLESRSVVTTEKTGDLAYIWIDSQMNRLKGSLGICKTFGRWFPYYYLSRGKLKRNGSFESGRPITNWLFGVLEKSNIANKFHVDLPARGPTSSDFKLLTEVFKKSLVIAQKDLGAKKLYVIIYPGNDLGEKIKFAIRGNQGIEIIDFSRLFKPNGELIIAGDGHPSSIANKILGERLAQSIP